jgi:thioredoxin 1
VTILIGVSIVVAAGGGLLGSDDNCRPGGCSTTRNPLAGAIIGAVLLGLVAYAWLHRGGRQGNMLADIPSVATREQFDAQVLKSPKPVLVDFFATWCEPCHELEPTIASLETAYRGRVAFVRVDVDAASAVAKEQGIEAMPTLIVFSDGRPAAPPIVGVHPEEDYRRAIEKALAQPSK